MAIGGLIKGGGWVSGQVGQGRGWGEGTLPLETEENSLMLIDPALAQKQGPFILFSLCEETKSLVMENLLSTSPVHNGRKSTGSREYLKVSPWLLWTL